jgi:hypothetical protein
VITQWFELELELPREQWLADRGGCCRRAVAELGEPLRWAITAAEARGQHQWLRLEGVVLLP